ncbi:MarR family winged helix-turn-helix transcriptional regulator [Actinomadura harenae]|uniref:MarR family transcriptional regulator n=1 Tax=Actinomadura harenae TaxID=2483351 RepID=A0A3M2M9H7_9ACTN|nr:MarR family transcriptional regulator [Actinomadura harenae]RMI46121.1 MarR family transcriptional regulator [Actinomadura harenae]
MSGPLQSPGFWLHHAALAWRAELDARLRPLGLTHTQFMLLATASWLEHLEGPPTQQQVADQAGTDRHMASRVLRTLEELGLITRHAHETSARALRLTLTPQGWTLTRQAVQIAQALDTQLFGPDPASLRTTLRTIAEHRDAP